MPGPSIVPEPEGKTIYIVEDDFGHLGRVYRETNAEQADRETTLMDLYTGQYEDPARVVAFNIAEGWCRDVSAEFATELQQRADRERHELTGRLAEFVIHHARQT